MDASQLKVEEVVEDAYWLRTDNHHIILTELDEFLEGVNSDVA